MKTTPRIVLCSAILIAGGSGCVIPIGGAEVGDVRVTWSFDGSQRCTEVGVDNVTVQLIEKGKEGAGGLAFGQTGACIEGSMVLPDVVAGNYTMTVVGDGDVAVFSNGKGIDVEVKPNQETPIDAALSLANGEVVSKIEFQYLFPGALNCSAAGVATITAAPPIVSAASLSSKASGSGTTPSRLRPSTATATFALGRCGP
jgi:hypothetical protein